MSQCPIFCCWNHWNPRVSHRQDRGWWRIPFKQGLALLKQSFGEDLPVWFGWATRHYKMREKMELSRDWMITKMLMWATEVGMQSTTTVTMETYIIVKTHFKLWASFPLQKSAWVLFRQSLAGSAGALFLSWLWSSDLHGRMLRNNAKHSPKIHPQNHHLLVYFATSRWEAIQNLSILPPVSDQTEEPGYHPSLVILAVWNMQVCEFQYCNYSSTQLFYL